MAASLIEWTDTTWNPVVGCTRASAGCDFCYAVTMTRRLEAMGQKKYADLIKPGKSHFNGTIREHGDALNQPFRWRKPRRVFVNSMSDLFHRGVSDAYILDVFDVMRRTPQHQYQVLTKRPERVREMDDQLKWPSNVWMGTSVENAEVLWRVDDLRATSAEVKFLSCEPLIGPLSDLDVSGVDWVIVGGESGPKARPMAAEWVREIRDRCMADDVAFFFKQWGGVNKKKTGRELDGQLYDGFPVALQSA